MNSLIDKAIDFTFDIREQYKEKIRCEFNDGVIHVCEELIISLIDRNGEDEIVFESGDDIQKFSNDLLNLIHTSNEYEKGWKYCTDIIAHYVDTYCK